MAQRSGFQFHAAAMEKQSLTRGHGHKEMVRRGTAHRHGEDFNADVVNEYSYKMGVWCAKTVCACWRQALMVEFVNNQEETIAIGVAKAIARHEDGVHDVRVKDPCRVLCTTTAAIAILIARGPIELAPRES